LFDFPWGMIPEDYEPPAPKPKAFKRSVVEARGAEGQSALESIREREEKALGKRLVWVTDGDSYVLRDAPKPEGGVIVKRYA
jgi:hypothetical protein